MSQQVIPSYLQSELESQICQQVESYIASLRKQIADGCAQVLKSQKSPITQSTRKHITSCHASHQAIQPRLARRSQQPVQMRLAPRPLLPEQLASVLGPKLTPPCLPRPNVRVYHVAYGSQQPPHGKKINIKQYLNEVDLRSTQVEKKRRRLMFPEGEAGG
ncbi:hypothetical protein BKA60DRAFT_580756 [Fusarium oxysporum]|nr:hypothetical protein DER44DRAFT_123614 [Fusarium oxysporum]KAH7203023.1 hypothetical protein BKA60DRAFT_580756 [Fusarium oxysporum]